MKKKFQAPHVFVIVLLMIFVATVLTYILPAGAYERYVDEATGRTLLDAASYAIMERTPVSFFSMFEAIPAGLIDAADIVSIVLIYGGAFGIINSTNAIECGIAGSIDKMKKYSALIIPVIMVLFSLMGAFLGISESCYAFIPVCIILAQAMGYDAIVGFAMVMMANILGFTAGPMNMWSTGVAQQISELPLFSGIEVRMVVYVVLMVIGIGWVLIYAGRIKKNPEKSFLYNPKETVNSERIEVQFKPEDFTNRKKITLGAICIGFVGLIIGIAKLGWWSGNTIGGYLLLMAIIVGIIDRKKPNQIAIGFVDGTKNVLMGALVVGFARAILIVLTNGNVIDTILYVLSSLIGQTSSVFAAILIYLFQFLFNFLVPSGSGQAATTMPIIAPMADLVGVSRQTAVLAFQLGDGYTNLLWPTAALAPLAMGNISYGKWLKFYLPMTVFVVIAAMIILSVCVLVGYGPF